MTGATATETRRHWERSRDKYGRSCHHLITWPALNGRYTLGVVVCLPKVAREAHPGRNYLSNDWTLTGVESDDAVQYHRTLAEAKARLEAIR